MAREDPPYSPTGPGQDPPAGPGERSGGDAVLAAIAHRLRARSERQQLLTERLRTGELRPGALADLAELAGAARRGVRDGEHILVLSGAPRGPRMAAPPTPLGQALNTVVAASEAASRTVVPPTPSVSVDATAEPVLAQILAELLAHAAGATPPGERLELHTRWGPDGGVVVELQCATPPRHLSPVDELDRALNTATPAGPVAPQEIGLHVAARLARAIGARLGVRDPAGNTGAAPVAVLHLPSSVVGGGQQPEQPAAGARGQADPQEGAAGPTAALRRPSGPPAGSDGSEGSEGSDGDAPWPPPAGERRDAPAEGPGPSRPPAAPAAAPATDDAGRPAALPRRSAQGRSPGVADATPFGAPDRNGAAAPWPGARHPSGPSDEPGPQGPARQGPGRPPTGPHGPGASRPAPVPPPGGNGAPRPGAPAAEDVPPVTEALPVSGGPGTTPPVELFGPFDSEVPVPVDDADDTPIFASVASAWFREPETPQTTALPVSNGNRTQADDWQTPGDAEFDAARIRADRVVDLPTTAQGLPQRLPGQAMVPPPWRETPNGAQPSGSRDRQPDRVRSRLASYQRGLREGRHRAAEDNPEPVPGGPVQGHPDSGHGTNGHGANGYGPNGHAGGHRLNGEGGRNAG